jgi:hypothetical protein
MRAQQKNERRIYVGLSDQEKRDLKALAALRREPLMDVVADACREYMRKSNPQIATSQENA